ncbi:PQQ-like beta-propeller repeat protein [Archangium violaceum]|uniref:PQQ-binding-like beta-propeller repeat protein n=1 Tax=Archangium violaceum TaxID=83451 RepID=UPI001951FDE6|nr:PQQ-binding-like beta-propeller repeat protein [Archangium violaceum]QRO02408.1 PQQ-like beta-propeller repeat protein [Archangium violaceum]
MLRKVLATVLLLGALSGCTVPARTCTTDADCQANGGDGLCDLRVNLCYAGSKEVSGDQCDPACAPYQACTKSNGCVPRYTGLVVTPGDGGLVGGGVVAVRAELVADPTFELKFPETLSFSVVRSDGGTGGSLSAVPGNAGVYTAQWTPPAGDGVFLLTAAYPDGGSPSTTVHLTVDATPPSFTVIVPAADAGVPDGGFAYADPMAVTAWRRDQTVTIRVESDSADLDPSSLRVVVRGHGGGASVTDLSLAPVTPCGRLFCGTVDIPLWRPGLPDFRGNFTVEVTAKDQLGNERMLTGTIPVTRWKWSFNGASGSIEATPAVGQLGTIYFGTSDSNGKVFALNPEGTKKWETSLGKVVGSPALGAFSAGTELVYVGANSSSGGVLYALGADGGVSTRCPGGNASGEILASVAIASTRFDNESAPLETAIALGNGDALISLRPEAIGSRLCRTDLLNASQSSQPGASIIVKGSDAYFSALDTKVWSYQFSGSSGWAAKAGFAAPTIGTLITGLGFATGNRVVGAGGLIAPQSGGVFSFLETDGSGLWKYPDPFTQSTPVRNMSIGAGNQLFFGREVSSGRADMTSINLLATDPRATATNAGSFPAAPVLGKQGIFYTASYTGSVVGVGEVSAWNATNLTNVWRLSDSVGRTNASPTLDCARSPDGTAVSAPHGVLYVPSIDGKLYAFVVDSPGLDPDAPWPKYQHDARNTGNPNTPISSCP